MTSKTRFNQKLKNRGKSTPETYCKSSNIRRELSAFIANNSKVTRQYQARREGGSGGVTARGPGRPDYVNFFTILLSVRRYAMTVDSSQSQRNLKLQSTAETR